MATKTITLELPEALIASLDSLGSIEDRPWKAFVLDLFRDGTISQGREANFLRVTRYDILDLTASHCTPSGPLAPENTDQDIENSRQFSRHLASVDGS